MNEIDSIPEQVLQRAVHHLLSNPSNVYTTTKGKRLQVLAPGRLNVHEGPDFTDMAILLGSDVVLGCGEFHRKSSDWIKHGHNEDVRYKKVILHIVVNHDNESEMIEGSFAQTLIIDEDELRSALRSIEHSLPSEILFEDIHTYSLLRLLRITAAIKQQQQQKTTGQMLLDSVKEFLVRFEKKRRRPAYPHERLEHLLESIIRSLHARFVQTINSLEVNEILPSLNKLIETEISDEGAHLRREIIVNSILPVALTVAGDAARIKLFEWYWSVTALFDYGILKRKFPGISQTYLWQQQGMLEILREKTSTTSVHEEIKQYGLQQTLHFYKLALEAPEIEERP